MYTSVGLEFFIVIPSFGGLLVEMNSPCFRRVERGHLVSSFLRCIKYRTKTFSSALLFTSILSAVS